MFIERLAPALAVVLAQEQVQVRLSAGSPEAQVVPRRWFEAARRFAYRVPPPRIATLLCAFVGSEYEKRRSTASYQEQDPRRPNEPHRLRGNRHSRANRDGACPTGRGQGSHSRPRHSDCAPAGHPASGSGLGENLAADHIRRADFPFIVADTDVLDNRIAAIIDSVRDNAFPLIREAATDLSDQIAVVVANLHFSSS